MATKPTKRAQATADAAEQLDEALGQLSEAVTIKPGGKAIDVTVTPFRLREFAQVLRCVQRLREAGALKPDELAKLKDAVKEGDAQEAVRSFDMLKMFLAGGDEIINIISVAVGGQVQAQTLNNLDLVDGAKLASAVFKVNLDFFFQNRETLQAALAPALKAVEQVTSRGLDAIGRPPSTDSEEQATT
jgi:hypothetical protein